MDGVQLRRDTIGVGNLCDRRLMPAHRERTANEPATPAAFEVSPDLVRSFRSH